MAEESETALLRQEAVTEVLEECYGEKEPAFLELASLLSSGRNDKGLIQAVERIYGFIQSHPFPDRWLEEQERAYAADTPVAETIWGLAVRARILDTLRYAAALLDKAVELADGEEKMAAAYGPALRQAREEITLLCRELPHRTWDETAAALSAFSFSSFGRLLKYERTRDCKQRVTALRDEREKTGSVALPPASLRNGKRNAGRIGRRSILW